MAFRASRPRAAADLGLLQDLPGTWSGSGWNLIARPDRQQEKNFSLELNATDETLTLTAIGGDIPNRGSLQPDIQVRGLHYLQRVTDRALHSAIHVESGLWIRVPPTKVPPVAETYVRQASIPHGTSLVAQSTSAATRDRGPRIPPVDSTPFADADAPALNESPSHPITVPAFLAPFTTPPVPPPPLPAGVDVRAAIKNPALVLAAAITGQKITKTVEIQISTTPSGGISNIPFLAQNANVSRLDAIFWIEVVTHPSGKGQFLQLQYLQRVILDFEAIHWPHISVATLVKQ